jgi:hypothetical protein
MAELGVAGVRVRDYNPPAGMDRLAAEAAKIRWAAQYTSAQLKHMSLLDPPHRPAGRVWRLTMQRNCQLERFARAVAASLLVLASGCTSVKMTGTPRTGTEQLLLTGTWDDALALVDFGPLAGSRVFLDAQYVTAVDKDWVISSIRRTMAEQGVLIENNKDKAQVILEAALGAYGTDERERKFGLPGFSIVPSLTTGAAVTSSGSSASFNLSETNQQDAVVKASLFAYETKTGRLVWESPPLLRAHGVRDHFVVGSGPYRLSSRPEVAQYPTESDVQTRKQFFRRLFGH